MTVYDGQVQYLLAFPSRPVSAFPSCAGVLCLILLFIIVIGVLEFKPCTFQQYHLVLVAFSI